MSWVTSVREDTNRLVEAFKAIEPFYDAEHDEVALIVDLPEDIRMLHQWTQVLPQDPEVLQWIDKRVLAATFGAEMWLERLALLKYDLSVLYYDHTQGRADWKKPPVEWLPPDAGQVWTLLDRIEQTLTQASEHLSSLNADLPTQALSPSVILAALWPYIYPTMVSQHVSAFDVRDFPLVRYHPHRSRMLIYRLIKDLSHKTYSGLIPQPLPAPYPVSLDVRSSPLSFQIEFTADPSHYANPPLKPFHTHFTRLIEEAEALGCQLEALRWETTQMRQILVSLPWA